MVSVEDIVENSRVLSLTDHSGADKTLSGIVRDGNRTTASWILTLLPRSWEHSMRRPWFLGETGGRCLGALLDKTSSLQVQTGGFSPCGELWTSPYSKKTERPLQKEKPGTLHVPSLSAQMVFIQGRACFEELMGPTTSPLLETPGSAGVRRLPAKHDESVRLLPTPGLFIMQTPRCSWF